MAKNKNYHYQIFCSCFMDNLREWELRSHELKYLGDIQQEK